jgi:hypothetical protein
VDGGAVDEVGVVLDEVDLELPVSRWEEGW